MKVTAVILLALFAVVSINEGLRTKSVRRFWHAFKQHNQWINFL